MTLFDVFATTQQHHLHLKEIDKQGEIIRRIQVYLNDIRDGLLKIDLIYLH